jgi:hypothetical protein
MISNNDHDFHQNVIDLTVDIPVSLHPDNTDVSLTNVSTNSEPTLYESHNTLISCFTNTAITVSIVVSIILLVSGFIIMCIGIGDKDDYVASVGLYICLAIGVGIPSLIVLLFVGRIVYRNCRGNFSE